MRTSDAPPEPGDPPPAPPPDPATPSGGTPGARGINRTAIIVGLGVLLTAVAVGLVAARLGDDGGDAEPPPPTEAPPAVTDPDDVVTTTEPQGTPSTTATTAAVQSIDGIEVVESGFSTYQGLDGPAGSYGLALENTSAEPITHITVAVVVLDAKGAVVGSYAHNVAAVQPGARLGLGGEVPDTLPDGIGRLVVRVAPAATPGDVGVPDGAFSVADVSTSSDEFGSHTTFTVSSSYDVASELANAYAVYRDAAGRIIGGASGIIDVIPPRAQVNGEVTAFNPVPNVAAADVYVDIGF